MNRRRLVLLITLLLFLTPIIIMGYRTTRPPEDLVTVSLNKKTIRPGEDLTLRISNYGFETLLFGQEYRIHRVFDNGTDIYLSPDYAFVAVQYMCGPLLGSWVQRVDTDLEEGSYYVVKEYTIRDLGEYNKTISFIVENP